MINKRQFGEDISSSTSPTPPSASHARPPRSPRRRQPIACLCHPHQPAGRNLRRCDDGAQLQVTRPRLRERTFRCIKTVDLHVRPGLSPINGIRVRALSSSACSPATSNGACASASRRCCSTTPTKQRPRHGVPAWWRRRSAHQGAVAKQITRLTQGDGLPVHSFNSLLADLRNLRGTQRRRHRDHTQLATHRAHKADPDTAQGIRPWSKSRCSPVDELPRDAFPQQFKPLHGSPQEVQSRRQSAFLNSMPCRSFTSSSSGIMCASAVQSQRVNTYEPQISRSTSHS